MSMYELRRKRNIKKVVPFTMMVVGTSGTGRTTFVNTLCDRRLLDSEEGFDAANAHLEKQLEVRPISCELEEDDGTRINLTVVDTPGFGDNIDNSQRLDTIVGYLETQFDEVLAEESRIRRNPRFRDNRVHACLYFIEPTGHGLREIDVELMRLLSKRVNVVPVIGRADSLTPAERASSKKMIMEDIEHYNLPIYNFPYDTEVDDEETVRENSELKNMLPFSLVCSTEYLEATDGTKIRARVYPWGYVDVEDAEHSDFLTLRSVLLGSHMQDLKDLTQDYHYELYRTEKLSSTVENSRDSRLLNPEDLANQSYRLKEEQLAREEEKLREIELRVQKEINEKRLELTAREQELREIEARISRERSVSELGTPTSPSHSLANIHSHNTLNNIATNHINGSSRSGSLASNSAQSIASQQRVDSPRQLPQQPLPPATQAPPLRKASIDSVNSRTNGKIKQEQEYYT